MATLSPLTEAIFNLDNILGFGCRNCRDTPRKL